METNHEQHVDLMTVMIKGQLHHGNTLEFLLAFEWISAFHTRPLVLLSELRCKRVQEKSSPGKVESRSPPLYSI